MASGKTTVGRVLARRLRTRFADADRFVAREAGTSIRRIFARDGEARFRQIEARVLAHLARGGTGVVAAGGGAPTRPETVSILRRAGTVVWIDPPAARLWARARRQGLSRRPLLAAGGGAASRRRFRALLAARRPLYARAAHLRIGGLAAAAPPARLARLIASRLEAAGAAARGGGR